MSSQQLEDLPAALPTLPNKDIKDAESLEIEGEVSAEVLDEQALALKKFVEDSNANGISSNLDGYAAAQNDKTAALMESLLAETQQIERDFFLGECDIFEKKEQSFYRQLDQSEIVEVQSIKAVELKIHKEHLQQVLKNLNNRLDAKNIQIQQQRELKYLYKQTEFRASLFNANEIVKRMLKNHHDKSAKVIAHIEDRHVNQVLQFNQADDRSQRDQTVLIDLLCRTLTNEEKSEAMKKHQSKLNHQKVITKKRLENMREKQRLELRHVKDLADLETRRIEEIANLKEIHCQAEQDLQNEHKKALHVEKNKISDAERKLAILRMQQANSLEIKALISKHNTQRKELLRFQKEAREKRRNNWIAIIGSNVPSAMSSFRTTDTDNSKEPSEQGTGNSAAGAKRGLGPATTVDLIDKDEEGLAREEQYRENEIKQTLENYQRAKDKLSELKKKQQEIFKATIERHKVEETEMEDKFEDEATQLLLEQEEEKVAFEEDCNADIHEALEVQERELAMEEHIRGAETKALIERKVLSSLLDTFVDGVVSIDPTGIIKRFNRAAEKMFGYTAEELLAGNVNIKNLMPTKYAHNHDKYILNYLTTGNKKVIGFGKQVSAKKKDGREFPVHLSISEVAENGFHLFTAIIRDMTEQVEEANIIQVTEVMMKWNISDSGQVISLNQKFKDFGGITTTEQELAVDVFGPDLVHPDDYQRSLKAFENSKRKLKPFTVKRRLKNSKGVYRWFNTNGIPVFDTKGVFKYWSGACLDVEDTVQLENELSSLRDKLPVFLWKANPLGEIVFANKNFENFSGADISNKPLMSSEAVCHPLDSEMVQKEFEKGRQDWVKLEFKVRLRSRDGYHKWFLMAAAPIFGANGELLYFYGLGNDIDKAELAASEMAALTDSLPQMRFLAYVGKKEGEPLNVFDKEVVHPDDFEKSFAAFEEAGKESAEFTVARRLRNFKGDYNTFITKGIPVLDDSGNPVCWYGTCTAQSK